MSTMSSICTNVEMELEVENKDRDKSKNDQILGQTTSLKMDGDVENVTDEKRQLGSLDAEASESRDYTEVKDNHGEFTGEPGTDSDLDTVTSCPGMEQQHMDQGSVDKVESECSQDISGNMSPGSTEGETRLAGSVTDSTECGPAQNDECQLEKRGDQNEINVQETSVPDKIADDTDGCMISTSIEGTSPQIDDKLDLYLGEVEISVAAGCNSRPDKTDIFDVTGQSMDLDQCDKASDIVGCSKDPEVRIEKKELTTEPVGSDITETCTGHICGVSAMDVPEREDFTPITAQADNCTAAMDLGACTGGGATDGPRDPSTDVGQNCATTEADGKSPPTERGPLSPVSESAGGVQNQPETVRPEVPQTTVTSAVLLQDISQDNSKNDACATVKDNLLNVVDGDEHATNAGFQTKESRDEIGVKSYEQDQASKDTVNKVDEARNDTKLANSSENREELPISGTEPLVVYSQFSVELDPMEKSKAKPAALPNISPSDFVGERCSTDTDEGNVEDITEKGELLKCSMATASLETGQSVEAESSAEGASTEEKMEMEEEQSPLQQDSTVLLPDQKAGNDPCPTNVAPAVPVDDQDLVAGESDWPCTESVHELGMEPVETNMVRLVGSPDDDFVEHIQSNFRIPVGTSPEPVSGLELGETGPQTHEAGSWPEGDGSKGDDGDLGGLCKSPTSPNDPCDEMEVQDTQADSHTNAQHQPMSIKAADLDKDIADGVNYVDSKDLFPLVESALQEDSQNALHGISNNTSNRDTDNKYLQDTTDTSLDAKSAPTFSAVDVEACRKELQEMEQALSSFGANDQRRDEDCRVSVGDMAQREDQSVLSKNASATSESTSLDGEVSRHSTEASSSMDSLSTNTQHVPPLRISLKHAYSTINMHDSESSNSSSGSASTGTTLPLDMHDISALKDGDYQMEVDSPKPSGSAEVTGTEEVTAKETEEPEFAWDEYLEDTSTEAAPDAAFPHVEASLRSNFEKGMKFEVAASDGTYWIGSVVMPCGQLLRLRYDGLGTEGSKDFWCDAFKSDIHPLGWCRQNGKTLEPPSYVKEVLPDWESYLSATLEQSPTASAQLLGGGLGTAAVDQIKQGMVVEVQHDLDHTRMWIARVLENIGGRLLLRYEGTDWAGQDFWLFYLHHRLHPLGWGQDMGLEYGPPEAVVEEWGRDEGWKAILDNIRDDTETPPFPAEVLMDQEPVSDHSFKVGWRLEAVNPINRSQVCPATVVQTLGATYFLLQIDDLDPSPDEQPAQMCCHGGSKNVLPVNWCQKNGIKVTPPNGWQKDFNWTEYLSEVGGEAAPDEYFTLECDEINLHKNARLESVDPENPGQICVATVTQVIPPLIFIHLESSSLQTSAHIIDCQSQEIFPVGWCESNNYPLKPPHPAFFTRRPKLQKVPESIPDSSEKSNESNHMKNLMYERGGSWCPKIYFNHRCFSGPYLSKGRIAELPKCVGPGPVTLVMKEVLSMLINVAYKSSRVLRELQMSGPADPDMHQQVLKAKYKGKSYRAMVQLCKTSDQVVDFCKHVCEILECCSNLFSPTFVKSVCPEKCDQLSKTKYTVYCSKKKRVGRPPGGHTNLEFGAKKPGKRRRRKRLLKLKKSSTSTANQATSDVKGEGSQDNGFLIHEDSSNSTVASMEFTVPPDGNTRKRKYTRHTAPPHEMKTRGVKLPRYSFERRSHRQRGGLPMNPGRPPKYSPIQQRRLQQQQLQQEGHRSAFRISPRNKTSANDEALVLRTNPLWWTVSEVIAFIRTTDCFALARLFKEEEIDGQALLMLNLPTVQELMEVKLGPAIKLCHLIERLKLAFFQQYAY